MSGLRVHGLRELNSTLRRIPGHYDQKVKELHRVSAERVMRAAIPKVPVRSQKLQNSVRALASKRSGRVAAGRVSIPYAGVIHYGWPDRNITAQPFLTDALAQEESRVVDEFMDGLERIIALGFARTRKA